MKKQRGFTGFVLIIAVVVMFGLFSYGYNAVKFASCDFKEDWKCEAVHGAGVAIPPISLITAWFDDDSE